jgi:ABC-type sugar transport system substrate-binding protein
MKKRLFALLLLVAALCALLCMSALADDANPLRVAMQVSQNSFTEPTQITVSIRVSNTGSETLPGPVTLFYPNGKQV